MDDELVGVILAAGRGARMAPLSATLPKALLPVCNKPIIQYQIEGLREAGVRRVFVVVGHLQEAFEQFLPDVHGIEVEYVTQESQLGIAHAVLQLEQMVNSPFILVLGDIFFAPLSFTQMVKTFRERNAGGVLAASEEDDPDMIRRNFAILKGSNGRVERVIEKPRHVTNRLKGCGVYLFDASVFDSIRRTPRTALRDEYEITDSIQMFIDDGADIYVWSDIQWDMNMTHPRDLLVCNLRHLRERGEQLMLGARTVLPSGSVATDAVIGSDVTIEGTPTIRNAVILSGSRVEASDELTNCLVTSTGTLTFPNLTVPAESAA